MGLDSLALTLRPRLILALLDVREGLDGGYPFSEKGFSDVEFGDQRRDDDVLLGDFGSGRHALETFLQYARDPVGKHHHPRTFGLWKCSAGHRIATVLDRDLDTSLTPGSLRCKQVLAFCGGRGSMKVRSGNGRTRRLEGASGSTVGLRREESPLSIVPVRTMPPRGRAFRRVVVTSALSVGALAACTSTKAGPTFDTRPPSTIASASTSTALATTSTVVAATAPVVTTVPVTTTVAATTTSSAPATSTDQAVRNAIDKARADGDACMRALPKCDVATLAASRGGVSLESLTKVITQYNAEGQVSRNRERNHYKIESVTIQGSARASAVVCNTDGSERVLPGAGPNGVDIIVNDSFVSRRDTYEMQLDADGVWRLYGGSIIGDPSGVDLCPVA